jgi:CxxC-x17-CxxC domain-containing protein
METKKGEKMFEDKTLKCADCGCEFVFTASEQEFYQEKGFENIPKRCPECRSAKKQQRRGDRPMYEATCAECGAKTKVPFQPTGERPVYCSDCFRARKDRY